MNKSNKKFKENKHARIWPIIDTDLHFPYIILQSLSQIMNSKFQYFLLTSLSKQVPLKYCHDDIWQYASYKD